MKTNRYFKKVILKFVVSFVFLMSLLLILPVVLADNNLTNTAETIGDYDVYVHPSTCLDDGLIPLTVYEDATVKIAVLAYTCSSDAPKIKTFFGYIPITFAYKIGVLDKQDFKYSKSDYIYYYEKQVVDQVSNSVQVNVYELGDSFSIYNNQWTLDGDSLQDFKDLFIGKEFMGMDLSSRLADIRFLVDVYDGNGNTFSFYILEDGVVIESARIPSSGMSSGSLVFFDDIDVNALLEILSRSE